MVFVEDPWSRIVAVHWKDDGEPPPGPDDGPPGCGNGWFPMNGYYPGGDGFPAQILSPPANLDYYGGVFWNPIVAINPPKDDPYLFIIPGHSARGARISIVWQGVVPPVSGPPLVAGLWLFPGRVAYPPYLDSSGHPPPNPPPFNPDLSADVIGSGRLTYAMSPPTSKAIIASFVATGGTMLEQPRALRSPFLPSAQDAPPPHYGFPDALKPSEGIWIEVEHDCS
jgi:hypothetical protein